MRIKFVALLCAACAMISPISAFAEVGVFDPESVKVTSGKENISAWNDYNDDVNAWLKIPGTNINHAVVIGDDNNYYTNLGYDKKVDPTGNGVLWADSYTTFGDRDEISRNTVIYGHNWTNIYSGQLKIRNDNDKMFAQLAGYHYLSFAKETPYIYYSTADEEMVWQVFSAFYTDLNFYYIISNPDDDQFKSIVGEALSRSLHDFDTPVTMSDKIITLSTCTRVYGQRADQRFVVMAKLLTEEEAKELDAVEVVANTDFKAPQF